MDITTNFLLPDHALNDIRRELAIRIRLGLGEDGGEIKALPAWIAPPDRKLSGSAVVVDTGGTNMRAALVEIGEEGSHRLRKGPFEDKVPRGVDEPVEGKQFFLLQASLVSRLEAEDRLPLGYCFSYPARLQPDGDAILIRWTKGIQIRNVEGELVGRGLEKALEELGWHAGSRCVLNDTVATLTAGAFRHRDDEFPETIGLIAGTGTNMATFLPRQAITKLDAPASPEEWTRRMALNLESGNFHPPHLTGWDDQLDATSIDPGRQRFEKAVSGFWLPYLFRTVFPDSKTIDPEKGTKPLADLAERDSDHEETRLARALLDRSADLVAAGIAGVCDLLPEGAGVTVVAEGSLFWKTDGYPDRVQQVADRLLTGERRVRIERVEDANFVGSACAALAMS